MEPPREAPPEVQGADYQQRQIDYLTHVIQRLEAQMPTEEEMQYLRERKLADERAAWAWLMIKRYAPWVATAASIATTAVVYLATHNIHISSKP